MNKKYWIIFGACQTLGATLPWFANVHTNIMPLVLGFFLLMPGSLVGFVSSQMTLPLVIALAVPISFAVWYLAEKRLTGQIG